MMMLILSAWLRESLSYLRIRTAGELSILVFVATCFVSAKDGSSAMAAPPGRRASPPRQARLVIDAAWLARRGEGPYLLNQAGTTYVLATDVRTPGTAFIVGAKGVALDLSG